MIPKIIHYCWFGHGEKPEKVKQCIESWRITLPNYVIKEWNEDNFNYKAFDYTREAYALKKYAFVSDVVRLFALYTEGGIYLDTDVKVIKSFDTFLSYRSFIGRERPALLSTAVIGSEPNVGWVQEFLNTYTPKGHHFINNDGSLSMEPNTKHLTFFINWTWEERKKELKIFEDDFFCCNSLKTLRPEITENSVAIHYFDGSWTSEGKTTILDRLKNLKIKFSLRFHKKE